MPLAEVRYRSAALEKAVTLYAILPEGPGPFRVLYLLHGLSDDHSTWARNTCLERYATALGLMVVMPDGGRGFYTDAVGGPEYETAIVRDVIDGVDAMFQTVAARGGRAIAGLSMGGYGAMKLALKYPHMFASASSHSGAFDFGNRPVTRYGNPAEFARILHPHPLGGPNDVFTVAAAADPRTSPALRIDCGVDDFVIEVNRDFHAHLDALGIAHEYAEFPGGHDWDYWEAHIPEALRFHARHLGLGQDG